MTPAEQDQREGELRWRMDCADHGSCLMISSRLGVWDFWVLPMQIGG